MKVAVFDAVGTWFSAPTLRCVLEELEAEGADVDVYLRHGGDGLEAFRQVCPRRFPVQFRIWSGDWLSTLRNWKWFVKYRGWEGALAARGQHYDLAIGVNPEGVVAAHRLHQWTQTPYVYLSFEMMFRDELTTSAHLLEKDEETLASQEAALIISQDEVRARLLCEENGLDRSRVVLLPVAGRGGAKALRGDYLRTQHQINDSQTVVLHAGTFGRFTCADELMDTLPLWPVDCVLVVNTHYRPNSRDRSVARLEGLRLENVRIARCALAPREYEKMLESADIGLALYRPTGVPPFGGKNISFMGLSSGKVASYVRAGVPVIVMGNPTIKEFMRQYRFGWYADDAREIPCLLEEARTCHREFAQGAALFFAEQLDFNRFWPPIWQRITSLIRS